MTTAPSIATSSCPWDLPSNKGDANSSATASSQSQQGFGPETGRGIPFRVAGSYGDRLAAVHGNQLPARGRELEPLVEHHCRFVAERREAQHATPLDATTHLPADSSKQLEFRTRAWLHTVAGLEKSAAGTEIHHDHLLTWTQQRQSLPPCEIGRQACLATALDGGS
jgi:hypothetical protein